MTDKRPGRAAAVPIVVGLAAVVASAAPAGLVGQAADDPPATIEILPLEEETRLALSAAPKHLREGAGVLALTSDGFVSVRGSSNGFTCVVNRDHPRSRKPTCYDAEGTATILPKVKLTGELFLAGVPVATVRRRSAEKFEEGEFIAPRRPGVAYMLSREIRNYDPRTGRTSGFPPHLMFYAPNLTNDDIGFSRQARLEKPWLPFVGYQGPHGFIIVIVEPDDH
ncbi:MAG: hypothetical protein ACODAA_00660 [Gemmatimonadota bacterium]